MWLIVRLAAAAAGFCLRLALGRASRGQPKSHGSIEYSEEIRTSKGRQVLHRIGMPLKTRMVFVITRETPLDRFFKALGLSVEIQSGDARFDSSVYIACDHPQFARLVAKNEELRRDLEKLLSYTGTKVVSDRRAL